jgi:hypothetical protein
MGFRKDFSFFAQACEIYRSQKFEEVEMYYSVSHHTDNLIVVI